MAAIGSSRLGGRRLHHQTHVVRGDFCAAGQGQGATMPERIAFGKRQKFWPSAAWNRCGTEKSRRSFSLFWRAAHLSGVRSHFSGEQRTCQAFVLTFLASSALVRRSFSLFWRAAHLSGVRSHFSGEQRTCQAFVLTFLASSEQARSHFSGEQRTCQAFSLFWRAAHLSGVRSHFSGEQRTCQAFVLTFLASSAPVKARSGVFGGSRQTRRPGRAAHQLQAEELGGRRPLVDAC